MESGEDEQERVFPASAKGRSGPNDMTTEKEEFLVKLKYPNREKVKRHIQIWTDSLTNDGILRKQTTTKDNVHSIHITTDDINRFTPINLSFTLYFRDKYTYGKPSFSTVAPPPEFHNEYTIAYTNAYHIYEY